MVYRRWAEDWVTSEMGGGGGTGFLAENGSVLICWSKDPLATWDVKFDYGPAGWRSIEPDGTEDDLGVVEAFMTGLHFEGPSVYRWPRHR